jgi:hypothetical protein
MNIVQRWVWGLLGYKCCLPVHQHELNKILKDQYKATTENMQLQLDHQRGQLFEFFRQQEEQKEQKVIEVRLVK